ncbi:SsgA family sporulation/cell division regulator [Streptomyces anthocyanicus]|uniref:SsgA family sporulation/cell division regulator n=1 Tax=Streptomyces anthocyanicus TaxID=68174 RepID=UPI0022447780|nr:SsgA family sporulation/cell division regulator [Streptomyces anthocyanicus]MCW8121833.1 SsgA family sporulation/cell division regulator [Streptomyces anthocyanicus]
MTAQTGGAMDAHPVADSRDAFDALLDASSLGAPRVQAVRRRTPVAVRDLLASRLVRRSLPAADAPVQPAPLPERGADGARPPLLRASEEQEPQHAREGIGSHRYGKFESDSVTGRGQVFVSHSSPHENILYQLNSLTRDLADLAERILPHVFFDSFLSCPKEALKAIEAPMETRLLRQLFFPEKDSSRIGRYGMGVKLALASQLIREESWRSGTPHGDVLGSGRSEHTAGNRRARSGWLHGYGHNVPEEVWELRDTGAAPHVAAAVCHAVLPGGLGPWLVLGPYVSDPSARGMSTQAGQDTADHLLATAAAQRPQRRDVWWSPEEMAADAGLYDWLAAVWLSGRGSQGSRSSSGRQRSSRGNDRSPWLDRFLAVYGPGALARSHTVPQTMWEQLVQGLLQWPAPGPYSCLTAHHYWRGMRASWEERQTPGATGAAANQVHGFSERCPVHPYRPLERTTVSTYTRPDDRMRIPTLAAEFVTATAEPRNSLSWTCREHVKPFLLELELLLSAIGGTHLTSRVCRIEAAQEAVAGWETARLTLLADNFRIAAPTVLTSQRSDPYAVNAASEGPPREQTAWTFSHDLLGAWMQQSFSSHSNACAETVDRQSGDHMDTCMDIHVNTTESETVLQLKQSDLARFPDRTRENTDNQNEHRTPSALLAEWLSDARWQ